MKPSLPKGTRDFSPIETSQRRYIFETIRDAFELYGFHQLDAPGGTASGIGIDVGRVVRPAGAQGLTTG